MSEPQDDLEAELQDMARNDRADAHELLDRAFDLMAESRVLTRQLERLVNSLVMKL